MCCVFRYNLANYELVEGIIIHHPSISLSVNSPGHYNVFNTPLTRMSNEHRLDVKRTYSWWDIENCEQHTACVAFVESRS